MSNSTAHYFERKKTPTHLLFTDMPKVHVLERLFI